MFDPKPKRLSGFEMHFMKDLFDAVRGQDLWYQIERSGRYTARQNKHIFAQADFHQFGHFGAFVGTDPQRDCLWRSLSSQYDRDDIGRMAGRPNEPSLIAWIDLSPPGVNVSPAD